MYAAIQSFFCYCPKLLLLLSLLCIIPATTMPKHMRRLYEELWDKRLPIIEEFTVPVPQADYGIRPGYKVNLFSVPGTFTPELFQSEVNNHMFRKIQVEVRLPCGERTILVGNEYDKVHKLLVKAEADPWDGVPPRS